MTDILRDAAELLKHEKDAKGWCQRFTDRAITKISPSHSLPDASTAKRSLHLMKKNPGKYGYRAVHDLDRPYTLVYFDNCGGHPKFAPEEWCGHVGIYCKATKMIYSSVDYKMSPAWMKKRAGFYVPK